MRPESSSIITFAGLTSRWMISCACAASSAPATCSRIASASCGSSGPPSSISCSRSGPLHVAHRDVDEPVVVARVVDRDDVRVVDRGDRLRLADEALAEVARRRRAPARASSAPPCACSRQVLGLVDEAHAAASEQAGDPVAGELCAGLESAVTAPSPHALYRDRGGPAAVGVVRTPTAVRGRSGRVLARARSATASTNSGGKVVAELARVGRRLGDVREPDLDAFLVGERRLAGHALVDRAAERVDVGGRASPARP